MMNGTLPRHAMITRRPLPHSDPTGTRYLTDGGLETVLIFHHGLDLPDFAAFPVLEREEGRRLVTDYYDGFAAIARDHGLGLVLESPTWRASRDWGAGLGYDAAGLEAANRRAIETMAWLRARHEKPDCPMPISGCIGPRGDGYADGSGLTAGEAERYHDTQVATFAEAGVDFVTALTLTDSAEAIGILRAASRREIPAVISFTVETDGRLPGGEPLPAAVAACDEATDACAAYYMINCAHPTHFAKTLQEGGEWLARLGGVRANASRLSHAELDASPTLDEGDAPTLGREVAGLARRAPGLRVFGGCCGTDHRHLAAIARALAAREVASN